MPVCQSWDQLSLGRADSFEWRMISRNQDLSFTCAYCCWHVPARRTLDMGKKYVYVYVCMCIQTICVLIPVSACLNILKAMNLLQLLHFQCNGMRLFLAFCTSIFVTSYSNNEKPTSQCLQQIYVFIFFFSTHEVGSELQLYTALKISK
jgi:hypothetical protein